MTAQQLPARPSLDQLKRQAKDLLRAGQAGDPAALARLRSLPAFSGTSDAPFALRAPALHDAQSVIARELGFDSWNALRDRVEELTMEFGAAVTQFIEAATDGRGDRAARLLELHPGIAGATLQTALLTGNDAAVASRLTADPTLATTPGGPRDWEPLAYLCQNALRLESPAQQQGVVAIAERLFALGADPDARFPWVHHGVRRPMLWGAVCSTRSLALADALLRAGANPSDGVTLTIAASGGMIPALDLLLQYGVDVNMPWATDGSATVYAILQWSRTPEGVYWLLAHGADPNPVFAQNGETPLHAVARGWDVTMAERFVSRGADVARRRGDGRTPYALAELNGNRAVADWLRAHGAPDDLSEVDRFVAACSRGERSTADAMLAARPALRDEIAPEHYVALMQAAERGDTRALDVLLSCGFDVNYADDEIGRTPLHAAAMEGWTDAVRVLLAHGASVTARDTEFRGQPLVWAAEGLRMHGDSARNHTGVGKLLIEAGSPTDWEAGAEPAEGLRDILDAWRRDFGAGAASASPPVRRPGRTDRP